MTTVREINEACLEAVESVGDGVKTLRLIWRNLSGEVIDIREQTIGETPIKTVLRRWWVREMFADVEREGGTITVEFIL